MSRILSSMVAAASLALAGAALAADAPQGNPPAQSTTPPATRPMGPGMGPGAHQGMGPGAMGGMHGSQQMQGMMMQHMHGIERLQMSGNVDRDFAEMMIRHHEGAIAMAKVQIEQGKDEAMKKEARRIVSDSEKEIAGLKAALGKLK